MRYVMFAAVLMGYSGAALAAPRTKPAASPMIYAMYLEQAPARQLVVGGILRPSLFRATRYRT